MVDYLSPQTITDVVADGIFAQAEYDSDFNSNLGSIAHVDVESAGDSFVVHFKPTFGSIFTANAKQVASAELCAGHAALDVATRSSSPHQLQHS